MTWYSDLESEVAEHFDKALQQTAAKRPRLDDSAASSIAGASAPPSLPLPSLFPPPPPHSPTPKMIYPDYFHYTDEEDVGNHVTVAGSLQREGDHFTTYDPHCQHQTLPFHQSQKMTSYTSGLCDSQLLAMFEAELICSQHCEESGTSAIRPLEEPGTSAIRPLEEPGTSAIRPLEEPGTSAIRPLEEPGTSAIRPLEEPGTSAIRPLQHSAQFQRLAFTGTLSLECDHQLQYLPGHQPPHVADFPQATCNSIEHSLPDTMSEAQCSLPSVAHLPLNTAGRLHTSRDGGTSHKPRTLSFDFTISTLTPDSQGDREDEEDIENIRLDWTEEEKSQLQAIMV